MRAGKITNIEAGRGLAAVLVVLYHTTKYYFAGPKYWSDQAFGGLFMFGNSGVEFFFVLSGFIMVWIHRSDIGRPARLGNFLWKRFQRIYPFFWVVLAVSFPMLWGRPEASPGALAQSALLVGQDTHLNPVTVAWSLYHEIVFYGFCALVIAAPRIGVPTFLAWTLASALGLTTPLPPYLTDPINALFALGAAVAWWLRDHRTPRPAQMLGLGTALFLATGLASNAGLLALVTGRMLYGLGAALALAGAVELERTGRLAAPRWLTGLGAASYAIYLTHMLALTALAKAMRGAGLTHLLPASGAFVALACLGVAAGVAVHRLVETPILSGAAWLRSSAGRPRAAVPAG